MRDEPSQVVQLAPGIGAVFDANISKGSRGSEPLLPLRKENLANVFAAVFEKKNRRNHKNTKVWLMGRSQPGDDAEREHVLWPKHHAINQRRDEKRMESKNFRRDCVLQTIGLPAKPSAANAPAARAFRMGSDQAATIAPIRPTAAAINDADNELTHHAGSSCHDTGVNAAPVRIASALKAQCNG